MKVIRFFIIFLFYYASYGQIVNKNRVTKIIHISRDTLALETTAISPVDFVVTDVNGKPIHKDQYYINYQNSQLLIYNQKLKEVRVGYFKYPSFLTQTYSPFDKKLIVEKATPKAKTYSLKKGFTKADFFGGINTYGNITRGITVGNNQGSVLESGLDLQITGSLSESLKIRASIKDSNLPLQENGISQNINEFDRVFIELFTNTWNLKAGDVDLSNQDSYFLNFTKKINGAKVDVVLNKGDNKTTITASGALVRGRFNSQNISPQEGNQGPYRLQGVNGEFNIVIISGSETVYSNGIALKRGEQHDYTIDYNTSEIVFNSIYPINSTQRIIVDFQYSDQNYNRFVTHDCVKYETKKFNIGTYFYSESDIKSQPVQLNLSDVQKEILKQAGNDSEKTIAPSAQLASYDENRIQYIKDENGNFVQSSDENAVLYNVIFRAVARGSGDYNLTETIATGNIFAHVGEDNGNYKAEVQLFAPAKTQMAVVKTGYTISENSFIDTELAYSNNDQNLFSSVDDSQNQGVAATFTWQQQISNKRWHTSNLLNVDFVQRNFNNIEGLYNPEFNRDWNLDVNINPNAIGNQTYIRNAVTLEKKETQRIEFQSSYLGLGNAFKGLKNGIVTENNLGKFNLKTNNSHLENSNINEKGTFTRHESVLKYQLKKVWLTGLLTYENNKNKKNQILDSLTTQKYLSAGVLVGIGDSTKVYSKVGFTSIQIDSVKNRNIERVQNVKNYSLESQWIKNKKTSLNTFVNYRKVNHFFSKDIDIINARGIYTQQLFKDKVRLSTVYETSSGSTPQQNFTYIETEPGQGFYTYLGDLNGNNKKDFDEFEVAQFTDQANYLRVLIPNTQRVATQKAKISQSLFVQFNQFKNHTSNWLKTLSHFSNQSNVLVNKDQLKEENTFNINPFDKDNINTIGLQQNITTNFYFNRGIQKYSTTYTYQDAQNTQRISSDIQSSILKSHQINFQHNIQSTWVLGTDFKSSKNENTSTNFVSRNFKITSEQVKPNIRFLKDEFSTFETSYTYRKEANILGEEALLSHNFGFNYNFTHPKKGSLLASVNLIENKYKGPENTPASYKILEGLQPDRNYTWSLILQRNLTELLNLSITYNGRKNETSNAIHVGSVQLRANF